MKNFPGISKLNISLYACLIHITLNISYFAFPTKQTLPLPYQDIIAGFIGARPDIKSLIFSDPWLAYELFFGPAYPAGYRLFGPHTWSKAREHIARGIDNVVFPTKTRSVETAQSAGGIFRLTVNGFLKTAFMALMAIFILSVLT